MRDSLRDPLGSQDSIPDLVPGVSGSNRVAFKWKSGRQAEGYGTGRGSDERSEVRAEVQVKPHESQESPVPTGEMVELTGLRTHNLNGRIGIIRDFDPSTLRYTVELIEEDGTSRHILVRPANLDPLSSDPPAKEAPKRRQATAAPPAPPAPGPVAADTADMALDLANAVESCNLFQVQALLRDRADPNGRSSTYIPLLLEASSASKRTRTSLDSIALLLGWKADPEILLRRERGKPAVFSPEATILFRIFQKKDAESDEEREVLSRLEPGALAQARRQLKLPGPFALGGTSPATCLQAEREGLEVQREELEATSAHRLWIYSLDRLRPVLIMRPVGQPSALVVFLHGLFQSAQMLEYMVRDLSTSLPHVLFVMPTAPTRDAWGVGPAWYDHTRSASKSESLEACRSEILALLSSQGQEWGIAPERVVLAGFSMGGTLAAWTALQVPRCLAGLLLFGTEGLSFTGGWASPKTLMGPGSEWATGAEGLHVLQCHGREDTLCPVGFATTCADELRTLGCSVRSLAFRGVGHALSSDMLEEAGF